MGCGNNNVSREGLVSQPTEPSRAAARTPRSVRAHAREQKDRERAKDDKLRQERERNERHLRELKEKIRENEKASKAHVRKGAIKPPGPRGRGQRGATDLFVAPLAATFSKLLTRSVGPLSTRPDEHGLRTSFAAWHGPISKGSHMRTSSSVKESRKGRAAGWNLCRMPPTYLVWFARE